MEQAPPVSTTGPWLGRLIIGLRARPRRRTLYIPNDVRRSPAFTSAVGRGHWIAQCPVFAKKPVELDSGTRLTRAGNIDSGLLDKAGLSRGELTVAEWRVLKDLLPIEPENRGRGRPTEQHRSIVKGMLCRRRCGAPWRGVVPWRNVLPKYGSSNTVHRQFPRWSEAEAREAIAVTLAKIEADSGHCSIASTTGSSAFSAT